MVGKWHLGNRPGFFPTEHGFDSYFGLLYSNDMVRPWVQTDVPLRLYRGTEELPGEVDIATLTERYTEEAVAFIRENRSRPFFLYLAHSMPHVPLGVSPRFAGRSANGRYGDVVEAIDWSTGRVLDALRDAGVERDTLVIFTSDNGPWMDMPPRMLVDPRIVRTDAGSAGPLRGSKGTTWEGGVRVPFLARWPGHIQAGTVGTDLATTMDILPTLAGIVGAPLPAGRALDGADIRAFLEGRAPSPVEWYVYNYGGRVEGVRDRRWKLHLTFPEKSEPVAALLRPVARSVGALGRGRRSPRHRGAPGRTHAAVHGRGSPDREPRRARPTATPRTRACPPRRCGPWPRACQSPGRRRIPRWCRRPDWRRRAVRLSGRGR